MREKVQHPHGLRQQWWRLPDAPLILAVAFALAGDASPRPRARPACVPTTSATTSAATPANPRDTPVLTRLEVSQAPRPRLVARSNNRRGGISPVGRSLGPLPRPWRTRGRGRRRHPEPVPRRARARPARPPHARCHGPHVAERACARVNAEGFAGVLSRPTDRGRHELSPAAVSAVRRRRHDDAAVSPARALPARQHQLLAQPGSRRASTSAGPAVATSSSSPARTSTPDITSTCATASAPACICASGLAGSACSPRSSIRTPPRAGARPALRSVRVAQPRRLAWARAADAAPRRAVRV